MDSLHDALKASVDIYKTTNNPENLHAAAYACAELRELSEYTLDIESRYKMDD